MHVLQLLNFFLLSPEIEIVETTLPVALRPDEPGPLDSRGRLSPDELKEYLRNPPLANSLGHAHAPGKYFLL
jgi:hypothetical protein